MKANPYSPFRSFQGTHKNTDLVFFETNNQCFARARVRPANPRTQEQVLVRTYLDLASKNWDTLTPAQRKAWEEYTETYFKYDDEGNEINPMGINTYQRAMFNRQMLGLPLIGDAPVDAPPSPLTSIEQLGAQSPDTLGIEVFHGLTSLAGLHVVVRMTPAMKTTARTPRETDYRFVRGVSPSSAAALPVTGSSITFTPTRFVVDDGRRYGVSARVVRAADGIASLPRYGDFLKLV